MPRTSATAAEQILNPEFVRLLESLANGVVIADAAGTIVFSNQFLERMFHYPAGGLLGQSIEELLPAEHREIHARHRQQYNKASETRLMGAGRDLLGRRRDGSVFPVEVGLSPMMTSQGLRVVAIVTDITMRKHAEQRSTLQRDIAVILSSADAIQTVAVSLLVRETVDEIARATDQGASLIRQLMAFSRTQPQTPETLDVNEVVRSSNRMLQILAGKDIQFEFSLHPDECLVAMESSRLEQILMNLVANSRDAMPNGGTVRLSTDLLDGDQPAIHHLGLKPVKYVSLRVADTGHGIPQEIQPHIFEPFFSTKEEGRGSGLGLSTVYAIVRQHDGSIVCDSVAGEGAIFTIYMPTAEQARVVPVQDTGSQVRRSGSETILLVEDQPALRASIHRILERNGYRVVAAADGAEALRASEAQDSFDLLVTDIALPKVRGTELARQLLEKFPRLRVLYMSGYSRDKVPADGAHFIPKPFKRDALIRKIREVLDS